MTRMLYFSSENLPNYLSFQPFEVLRYCIPHILRLRALRANASRVKSGKNAINKLS